MNSKIFQMILVCLVSTAVLGQSEMRYHAERGHFSFDVPAGWHEIPIEAVKELEREIFKEGKGLKHFKYEAAFQKQAGQYLALPFLIVRIGDLGGVHETKIEKVFKSAVGKDSARMFLAGAKKELVTEVYESMRAPKITYDRKRHMFLTRCEMVLPGIGECVDTEVVILGKDISANLNLINSTKDIKNAEDTFDLVLESFAFDEGHEYRTGPIAKAVKVGWIGAVVLVLLCLLRHIRQRFI